MNRLQKLQLRQSEVRVDLGKLLDTPEAERTETYADDLGKLTKEVRSLETDVGAAIAAGDDKVEEVATKDTPEGKEYRELRAGVDFGRYVSAAMGGHGVTSTAPELELNQHLKIAKTATFPMELLAGKLLEARASLGDVDAGHQSRDLARSRVFHGTAAESSRYQLPASLPRRRGLSGDHGRAALRNSADGRRLRRRGRTPWLSLRSNPLGGPSTASTRIEDDARVPGLSSGHRARYAGGHDGKSVDLAVFKGDAGANEDTADVVGMQTASCH